jgi:hypothetical protein
MFENGLLKNALIGVGAVLVAPLAFSVIRPLTKQAVKGGLVVTGKVKEMFAEAGEQWSDIVAEAKTEMAAGAVAGATIAQTAAGAESTPGPVANEESPVSSEE